MTTLEVGSLVGSQRWPYWGNHPDCWGRPWSGTLLAEDDPRAWANTIAFPGREPSQAEATAHVAWCAANVPHHIGEVVAPVLWNFRDESRVMWERTADLRPYADDVTAWEQARAEAYALESRRVAAYPRIHVA
jgi:hypothetical protein